MSFRLPSKQREHFGGVYHERPAAQDSTLPAGLSPTLTVCLWGSDLAILSFSFLVYCRAGMTKSLRGQCMNGMKLIVAVINETAHRSCLGVARRQKGDSGLKDQEVQQEGFRGRRNAAGSRGGAAGRQQAWWWRRRGLSTVGLGTGPGRRGPEAPTQQGRGAGPPVPRGLLPTEQLPCPPPAPCARRAGSRALCSQWLEGQRHKGRWSQPQAGLSGSEPRPRPPCQSPAESWTMSNREVREAKTVSTKNAISNTCSLSWGRRGSLLPVSGDRTPRCDPAQSVSRKPASCSRRKAHKVTGGFWTEGTLLRSHHRVNFLETQEPHAGEKRVSSVPNQLNSRG